MAQNRSARHPPFRHRWFADDVIITCVRRYLGFKLEVLQLCSHAVIGWLDALSGLFGLRSIQMASI